MSRDALIVGINQYQYLPNLQAPARDAEAIAQCLQAYGEFRVHRLPEVIQKHQPRIGQKTSVTLRQLESELINLFKPKGANVPHTALFYFSGHGMQRDAGIQDGYLAVSDSQPDVGFSGLSLFWLRRLLQESPVRQRIIILDCCHSGEFLNFLEADPGARSGTDRLFMAASREYEAAYESLESPYSVFTKAILEGLDPSHSTTGLITNYALTTWVSHALKGEVQQPLFESSGGEIILTRAQGGAIAKQSSPSAEVCPYRGLECFEESHAEYFFGRSELTDQLLNQLRSGRFVAVVGASGSGKSSLVRAGLISELRKGQKFSGSDRWRIRLLTPTEHPLKRLAAVFVDPDLTELERAEQLRRAEAFLDSGGTGLAQLVRASLVTPSATGVGPRPHLLLIIDQFEEIFTLCNGPTAEQERQQFFNCLIDAIQSADRYLSVVIILRADFFGKCSLYSNLAQQVEQNLIMVTPMTYEQIKSTIIEPAQKAKLVCEPNLIYTMLLDVVGAPGELPLLQYTLSELWKHRQTHPDTQVSSLTLDAYTELGGIRGTLQKRATEIFNSLLPDEQIIAKRVFLALTQLGEGTEDTRRRVLKSELVGPSFPLYLIEQTLEKLVAAKLVVTSQEKGTWHRPDSYQASHVTQFVSEPGVSSPAHDCLSSRPDEFLGAPTLTQSVGPKIEIQVMKSGDRTQETIDVVHETLIRNWSLLRGWLEENREMLRRQRLIERASQEWNNAGQPNGVEYLLRGNRLVDAEDFLDHYPKELSLLAQHYTAISRMESQRARKESRLLQLAVPSMLLVALIVTLNQYRNAVQTQAEKEYQLQVATSRERAAIAQSILQEPNGDPLAALLISRLAAVQGGHTYEAQASLRASLQDLRLQFTLSGHTQAVSQMVFSPNHDTMATASGDGTIRLWSLDNQTLYTVPTEASKIISWNDSHSGNEGNADITALSFDPTGHQIVAIAQGKSTVNIWSVESGALIQRLQADHPLRFLQVSPIDDRVIAATDQTIWIWEASTGQVKARWPQPGTIRHIELSSDGQRLLSASDDGTVRVWQLPHPSAHTQLSDTPTFVLKHSQAVGSATFSPDHRLIATIGIDQQVRLWSAENSKLLTVLHGNSGKAQTGDRAATPPPEPSPLPESGNPEFASPDAHTRATARPFSIRFSPNGRTIAVTSPNQAVRVWQHDAQGQWTLSSIGETELNADNLPLHTMAFSPDSRFLVTGNHHLSGYDHPNAAYIWDLHTGKRLADLRGPKHAVVSSTFSPNGAYVATADTAGNIWVWAADEGGELPMIRLSHSSVRWAAFETAPPPMSSSTLDANHLRLMTVTADGRLNHWDLVSDAASAYASETVQSQATGGSAPPTGMVASPRPLSSLSIQRIWKHLSQFKQQLRPHRSATASQPDPHNATVGEHPVEPFQTSESSAATVSSIDEWAIAGDTALTAVAFGHQDPFIAVATRQGTIEIRRLDPSTKLLRQIQLPLSDAIALSTPSVQFLTFSPSNQTLLSISDDSKLQLWDVQSGDLLQTLPSDADQIQHAAFSPNGRWIVSASLDETAQVWDVSSGQLMLTLPHQASVMSAQFSPDSRLIVTASLDGTARIWDALTGDIRVVLSGHRGGVLDARFSPDGRSLATASQDGTLRLWDAATGTEQVQLRPTQSSEQTEAILKSFFSPDGHYVAALTEQGEIHLWTATWEMLLKLSSDRSLRDLTPEECIRYLRLAPNNCP